jgi:hypothetical protein
MLLPRRHVARTICPKTNHSPRCALCGNDDSWSRAVTKKIDPLYMWVLILNRADAGLVPVCEFSKFGARFMASPLLSSLFCPFLKQKHRTKQTFHYALDNKRLRPDKNKR